MFGHSALRASRAHLARGLIFLSLGLAACAGRGGDPAAPEPEGAAAAAGADAEMFFDHLAAACGEEFYGEGIYPDDPDHDLVGVPLRLVLERCEDGELHMPLYVGDAEHPHATWILTLDEDGLHLYHDHRGEDGAPDDVTGYGGYADARGTRYRQYFPADEGTREMIPEAATNVWMLDFDPDFPKITYYLERHDAPRYRAEFESSRDRERPRQAQ